MRTASKIRSLFTGPNEIPSSIVRNAPESLPSMRTSVGEVTVRSLDAKSRKALRKRILIDEDVHGYMCRVEDLRMRTVAEKCN
ncbi:hypothetical protein A0H81_08708 [Grifola frondosa]|uniref:Uncharacterized protein n=1 Tax=Grifola frondosa TaxID=5627 RepID=A0A1C7M4H1_GRIFR|nr:hypothetical protein A0H81_08708 [Grifola frondosa]